MRITKNLSFIFQFATLGLAAAFVILYFFPSLLNDRPEEITFKEAIPVTAPASPGMVSSYADAVAAAQPAVVNIFTRTRVVERAHPLMDDPVFKQFFGDRFGVPRERMETSLGSGVIVSPQGYMLTNNHVIKDADEIQVAFADGRTTKAKLVGTDPDTDLAILQVEIDKPPVITLGNSDTLRVGDVVLAIGNPFGVGQTVTSGIVSATHRSMLGISTYENFIQTDAAINPGNSGGALINAFGQLIGINTAIYSKSGGSQGIGFAIPVSLAKDVMTQIIQHGVVQRGWLGIAVQDITPQLAESFKLDTPNGVIVTNLILKGPADLAGLDRGDVITHINGKPVNNMYEMLNTVSQVKPETVIKVKGVRKGKGFSVKAKVVQRPVQE
ncbi:MAG: Do family serine endopeptidase [Gammaproteobacteria bacterium]|nr:Do family serine endopeptidase [Gammaproteobacteria bacterium]